MNKEKLIKKNQDRILEAEKNDSYAEINKHLTQKRLSWLKKNNDILESLKGTDVRKAYELIIIEYLKINRDEAPVVYEDKNKIIWRSYNWCPVLEACKNINIDSRLVCKNGWEESVQKMIEFINPNLVFKRNYKILRPHGKYCEEIVILK